MAQKFILTDGGILSLGEVLMHKNLLAACEECYGGGYYEIDTFNMQLLLSGASYDYGSPMWYTLDDDSGVLKVSSLYKGLTIIYRYEDPAQKDLILSLHFKIKYI